MKLLKTPKSLDLEITNKCNLRCKYCCHFTSAADVDHDLPTEAWLQFFEELKRCAVMDVTISGGEPFCREDIRQLLNGIVCNSMRFTILTNGTMITDEMAAFLSATGRCNGVQVSVDGSVAEVHDRFRGKGSFDLAISGIKHLQLYKIPLTVRTTIHKCNIGDLNGIATFLLDDLGLASFSTNAASFMGVCRQNSQEVQLNIGERSQAMETLLRLNIKYHGRIIAAAGPLSEGRNWLSMERSRRELKGPQRGYLTGCGCVWSRLAVRADGVIVPCTQLGHIELGRINHDSLADVWQNNVKLQKLRKRRDISLTEFEYCRSCDYKEFCTGNCPALAYTLTGDHNRPSPDACLRLFLEQGGRLPDVSLLTTA